MTTTLPPIPFVDLSAQHRPIEAELKRAVWAVIQRGDFILGQAVQDFEAAFASACGSRFGIGVGCGTEAIALGLQAAGIGRGDEVMLPANTFIATLLGVLRTGATPILVDCDPNTALIDLVAAQKAITPRTRAIVPVHLYGQMVAPHALCDLARAYDLIIFEDAAQAHLAERDGYRAGSVGVAAAFSFYPSKNLGSFGDGGLLVTGDEAIAQTTRALRNYGAPRKYYHTDLGTNSRLDTLQAAVLSAKLPHLPGWNRQRYRIAQCYDALLEPLRGDGILPITNESGRGHVYHLYVIRVTDRCRLDRGLLQTELANQGIQTGIHYPIPCHLQPAFRHLGYVCGDFYNAEMLCREVLSLPLYPGMTDAQILRVVTTLRDLVNPTTEIDPMLLEPTAIDSTAPNALVAG